ncbi:EAL domain-containing protein [Idiomarina sp. Sol25]|uniref:EAL domain-containing protein n=1 Tax=Idiomarina sp. Sol25 TaxID=3064000 RepID=UPI00294AEB99|nr:EAL domain-containing protein [Idiomarina sp. Sol25]MDV6328137.1 EAL domain-containing protein [Idiomarina sp. Sol25]
MQSPQKPRNELQRLGKLLKTKLLDSAPEDRFDRITRLARQLFDVPIALVSLVDAERQWFKSSQGLNATETHRDISFCGHAILQPDIFEVADASKDQRFADNPLVSGEPHIRFYAGAPLYTTDGHPIGTLCIIDKVARQLSPAQRSSLRDLADVVASEINQAERYIAYGKFKSLQELSEVIVRAQSNFIRQEHRSSAFKRLLEDILAITDSEYGFISDLLHTSDGSTYLQPHAITDFSGKVKANFPYSGKNSQQLKFHHLNTSVCAALTDGEAVVENTPRHSPDSYGLPTNCSALRTFIGIPLHRDNKVVSVIGLANRKDGYDQELLQFLKPLITVVEQIFEAAKRERDKAKLKQELSYLSNVASQTTNAVIITDAFGKTEWVNDGFTRLTGYLLEDIRGHKPGELLQGKETEAAQVAEMHAALEKGEGFEVDIVNYTKDNQAYWVRIYCNPLTNDNGALQGFISIQSNIDEQKRNELALKESAQFQNTILNTMVDGLVTTDQNGIIQMCNPATENLFGYSEAWLIGKNIKVLMPDSYTHVHDSYMQKYKASNSNESIMGKTRALTAKRRDGSIFPVEIAVKETQHDGEPLYVASIRDISALKEQQEEIEQLAYFDPLTHLANRRLLKARIKNVINADNHPDNCHSLLFIDLDNFKNINDSLGHSIGDDLLIEVGQRIKSCVLSCSDTVARLGGDEFCVLLASLGTHQGTAKERAQRVAERIIKQIEKPLMIDNERLKTSASIGVSFFCGEEVELGALMKQADIAMYEAKEQGKNRVCFFNSDLEYRLLWRLKIVSDLRTAIDEESLSVQYQPIVDASSGIVKVEALARWNHPTEGWISPETFISIAETYQLIVPLGNFVLRTSIKDMERWLKKEPGLNWRIAINISQFQLSYNHFKRQIEQALSDSKIDPRRLILEVTESSLAHDIDESIEKMTALKSLGLTFSLDDFGTGYSSLAYLKQLPISELKIDRSFVKDLPTDLDDVAIATSVLSLAKAMGLEVVAEGVEKSKQWEFLKDLKCDLFQGYYFSKPLTANDIANLIETGQHVKLV